MYTISYEHVRTDHKAYMFLHVPKHVLPFQLLFLHLSRNKFLKSAPRATNNIQLTNKNTYNTHNTKQTKINKNDQTLHKRKHTLQNNTNNGTLKPQKRSNRRLGPRIETGRSQSLGRDFLAISGVPWFYSSRLGDVVMVDGPPALIGQKQY